MNLKQYTRANDFDRIVGGLQTENVIELGVGNSVLDIGCGIGEYTPMYLKRFSHVVGIDPSKDYLKVARRLNKKVKYIQGYGETFRLKEKFDTISINNILEHVNDPIALLTNCKKHLAYGGRIIVQVPNAESITRQLGVLMGIISSLNHISKKERDFYGHKRVYTFKSLIMDCVYAELDIVKLGGILYKPLPNEDLWNLYQEKGFGFVDALLKFGKDRPKDCACIYCVCE